MAVVSFVSKDGSQIVCLDATTDVTYTRGNTTTQQSVMSGAKVSDTYRIGNPQISFNGVCTYSKSVSQTGNPTPRELELLINELITSYTRVDLLGNSLIPSLNDCVILNFSIKQDEFLDAITVSLTLEQQFISNGAVVTSISVPSSSTQGQNSSTVDGGNGSKTAISTTEQATLDYTMARKFENGVSSLL